jgi:amino acid adenylation domain-containing protein
MDMTESPDDFAQRPGRRPAEPPRTLYADAMPGVGTARPAPLSFQQESLWFLDRFAPGRATYNVPCLFRITGRLHLDTLRAAFAAVVVRHEALRTSLHDQDGVGVQHVHDTVDTHLRLVVPQGADAAERLAAARLLAIASAREPFDLTSAPLWRAALYHIDEEDHLLVFVVHHVVSDGWSIGVVLRDLAACYGVRTGTEGFVEPEPLPLQYSDYARWQRDWLRGRRIEELGAYWRERLAGVPVVEFPTDRPRPAEATFDGRTFRRDVPADVVADLTALARETGTSPFVVYLAAFLIVLHRHTGQEDLTIGSASANRGRTQFEPLVGYFVNMLVLRTDLTGDPTVRELISRVHAVVRDAMAHGDLPFNRVVDAVRPPRDPSRTPLFQIGFGLQNLAEPPELPGLSLTTETLYLDTARFDMTWALAETADGLTFTLEYNTNLFDEASMTAAAGHYEQVLGALSSFADTPVSRVPVLTPAEYEELLGRWNRPSRPVPATTLASEFEHQVARDPEAVAVVVGGRPTTYGEVNSRANRLAGYLADLGVERGSRVALCLPRDLDMIVAILATLKAGAAYVPIDAAYPASRISAILADATPAVVLAHSTVTLPSGGPPVAALDRLDLSRYADTAPPGGPEPQGFAYVLFTSGTTGKPKGVPIEHRSVVTFVDAIADMFEVTPQDRIVAFASLTFDVSVFEIFTALCRGARINIVRDDERLDMAALQHLIEETGTTIIDLPPPVMALLTPERFTDARVVMVGGEMFNGELVNRWSQGRRLFNGYGPTECTVAMVYHECVGRFDAGPPIGLPYANHVAHVVDRHLEPLPYEVAGELVIGGVGLTRGYLNDPYLTRLKIVPDPFGTAPGGRLYHTGDLVKRRRDGNLVCLGRIDAQVKIRGQRIELGEIETVLASHVDVGQVYVQAWTDPAGERHLVAYATPAGEADLDVGPLRSYIGEYLPRHMVPAYVVILDRLPLTVAGKVDARALPAPTESARTGTATREPGTETERVLAADVFAPLLRLDKVGVDDNFFEVGGNSLQATRLLSRIQDRFGVEIGLGVFFRSPTVAHLASVIDAEAGRAEAGMPERRAEAATGAPMTDEELLALVEQLPDEEVTRLLEAG